MANLSLRILEPDKPPREVKASAGMSLGRHPDNSCVLSDLSVGSHHARVVEDGGILSLEDLGSSNGTRVKGAKQIPKGERVRLASGLVLRLGKTTIEVLGPPAAAPPPAAGGDDPATVGGGDESDTVHEPSPPPVEEEIKEEEEEDSPTELGGTPPPASSPSPAPAPAAARRAESPPAPKKPSEVSKAPAAARPEPKSVPPPPLEEYEGTIPVDRAEYDPAAEAALFRVANPRLVIAAEALHETVFVSATPFVIGRGEKCQHQVKDRGVSEEHLKITFTSGRFFVRDMKSTNHTFLNEKMLEPGSPLEIEPNDRLRFGPIDALWVTNIDAKGNAVPAQAYEMAAQNLLRAKKITAAQKERAMAEARADAKNGRHVGELLLLTGVVSVEDWIAASRGGAQRPEPGAMARMGMGGASSTSRMTLFQVLIVIILLMIVAVLAKLAGFI